MHCKLFPKYSLFSITVIILSFWLISPMLFNFLTLNNTPLLNSTQIHKDLDQKPSVPTSSDVFDNGILYTGSQTAQTVNESGILNDQTSYYLGNGSVPNYSAQNTSLYLDTNDGWNANYYNASVSQITDTREWLTNPSFSNITNFTISSNVSKTFQSLHPYLNNQKSNPTIAADRICNITTNGCSYIRLHFANITLLNGYDSICLWNWQWGATQNWTWMDNYTGNYLNYFTPWYRASNITITMQSQNLYITPYGFLIDYYQTYNELFYSFQCE